MVNKDKLRKISLGTLIVLIIAMFLMAYNLTKGPHEKSTKSTLSVNSDVEKYNTYIALSNYMTNWLETILNNYFMEFGAEDEIIVKKDFKNFETYPILDGHKNDVDKALNCASEKPFYDGADDAIKALCPKLRELMETINEIENYYHSNAYLNDSFAKGKELHKKICVQYDEYYVLSNKFFSEFSVITDKTKQADLEKLKKKDMMIRYYAMSILIRAQDIQKDFYKAKVNDNNILDFDIKKYEERYSLLINDIDKFTEYSKDSERCKKENICVLEIFTTDVERVKVTATDIKEILRTKDISINSDTKGKVTTGGTNAILETYNEKVSFLVDSYNNVISLKVSY